MPVVLQLFYAFLILTISTVVSLLVTVPFYGALIRFRSNYTPKGLQLDGEGGAQPHVGPVVNSYIGMLLRVKRIEGWHGLYKGIMPMLLNTVIITVFAALYVGASMVSRGGRYALPAGDSWKLLGYTLFFAIISTPMTILVNRTITTPHRLNSFSPVQSLRLLLTPYELSRPWILYFTPGLLAAVTAHILYIFVILNSFRRLLLPSSFMEDFSSDSPSTWPQDFTPFRLSAYFLIIGLSTVVLCPLEVIATRLSLQRNRAPGGGFSAVPQDDPQTLNGPEEAEFAGADEDVIGLRSEDDPYKGLADCAKRIMHEEGLRVLFRGWWVTLLSMVLSAVG